MAELKQKEFGVNTQFQTITPHKAPDFREQNIKSGIALAGAIGKSEAAKAGRSAAKTLMGADLTLEDVNRNVDIFEETMADNVTDAQVSSGGTVSARQIGEIKDATLDQVKLSSRGLQEAINRGVISHLEATARANITVQRASNSLIGSLFQNEYRNALSKVTGNPAGSPALALNKSPAEVQDESNKKAIVEANAAQTKRVQTQAARDGSTFDQAEFKLAAQDVEAEKVAKMARLDKEDLRSDAQKLKEVGIEFSVATSPFMDLVTEVANSGEGIDPSEVATLTQNIKAVSDQIVNSHVSKGMGSKAQKELRESAKFWSDTQLKYVNDISQGKLSKDTQELLNNVAKNHMAADTPIIYAMSVTGNAKLAEILSMAGTDERKRLVKRWGFDVEKLTNITRELLGLSKVVDPSVKSSPEDAGKLPGVMAGASGEQNREILSQYKDSGGNLADLNSEWKKSPATSLQTIANSLGDQIEKGDKNSVEVGVAMMNESVEKYHRLIADYNDTDGNYSVSFKRRDVRTTKPFAIGKGAVNPIINFPNGVPEGEQEILKQLYRALEKTPSLWQDEFIDAKDVFENMLNQGFRFDATNIAKGDKPKEEEPSPTGTSIGKELDPAGDLISSILDFTDLDGEQALSDKFDRLTEQARKIREQGTRTDGSKPIKPGAIQIAEAKADVPVSRLAAESTARVGEGDITDADEKEVQQQLDRLAPSPEAPMKASSFLLRDEGYSSSLPANVPSAKSGITIAGLDLANGDTATIKKSLSKVLDKEVVDDLFKVSALKGKKAEEALSNIQISLTDDEIQALQDEYVDGFVVPQIEKSVGKPIYNRIPDSIKAPLEALTFLNFGPKSLAALKKAFETGKVSDFNKAIINYDNYWNKQSAHNRARSQRVADAISEHMGEIQ